MIPKELTFLVFLFFFATGKAGSVPPLFLNDSQRIDISHFLSLEKLELWTMDPKLLLVKSSEI